MKTNIRANCPNCGEVDLVAEDIHLELSDGAGESGTYWFECGNCSEVVSKPADLRIVELLKSGGVRAIALEKGNPEDPAFTYDDILDFHLELADEASLRVLLAPSL